MIALFSVLTIVFAFLAFVFLVVGLSLLYIAEKEKRRLADYRHSEILQGIDNLSLDISEIKRRLSSNGKDT